jgi:hypothetical protein
MIDVYEHITWVSPLDKLESILSLLGLGNTDAGGTCGCDEYGNLGNGP